MTRQKVVVKVPLEEGFKEQGGLHDMKWINTKKGDRVRSRSAVRGMQKRERRTTRSFIRRLCLHPCLHFREVSALIPHMLTEQVDSKLGCLEMMKEPGREQSTLTR